MTSWKPPPPEHCDMRLLGSDGRCPEFARFRVIREPPPGDRPSYLCDRHLPEGIRWWAEPCLVEPLPCGTLPTTR